MNRAAFPAAFAALACLAVLAPLPARAGEPVRRADLVLPCGSLGDCLGAPAAADRQVHPFEGALGRPCGYRLRETPSGTRKIRVCY